MPWHRPPVDLYAEQRSWMTTHSTAVMPTTHVSTTTTVLRPFFRDHPLEPVPEENFWTLWRKGRLTEAKINRGKHTDHPAGCYSIRTNQCPPPPSPHFFYRPDALPAAQPTVSKQRSGGRKMKRGDLPRIV